MVEAEEGLSKAPWKTVSGNVNGKLWGTWKKSMSHKTFITQILKWLLVGKLLRFCIALIIQIKKKTKNPKKPSQRLNWPILICIDSKDVLPFFGRGLAYGFFKRPSRILLTANLNLPLTLHLSFVQRTLNWGCAQEDGYSSPLALRVLVWRKSHRNW